MSGPAGGIVGMARTAAEAGFTKTIGFDMGGTSTDVSHFAGRVRARVRDAGRRRADARPMLSIHTVAAGGGSILHFDGSRLAGPEAPAGTKPGPACYRRGGPLTVTDTNVLLGRIQPDHFPRVFGEQGDQPLDADITKAKFTELSNQITADTGDTRGPEQVAAGFTEIAVANMANAIKKISVQRGYDVTEYVLNVFGGAGGQHACAVADALGMTRVLIHPLAGVLSAYGIGLADIIAMREQAVETPLTPKASRTCMGPWTRSSGTPAPRWPPRACRRSGSPPRTGRTCATRAPTPPHRPGGLAGGHDRRVRVRVLPPLLLPDARQAGHRGGGVRRGHRGQY